MLFGISNSNVRTLSFTDVNGKHIGSISYTKKNTNKSSMKKLKRLQYNMKQISAKIMRSKTSGSAKAAVISAKRKVAELKRKLKTGEYDDSALEAAIVHAMKIERVAKKHAKHIQEEEMAKKGGICNDKLDEEREKKTDGMTQDGLEEALERYFEGSEDAGECMEEVNAEIAREMMRRLQEQMQEEIQAQMQESMRRITQETMEAAMEETAKAGGFEELTESLSAVTGDMDPEDLEELKKKHRSEELKEIAEADMKYLKAMFDRLQSEKESASGSSGFSSGAAAPVSGGVTLELGGADMPVEAQVMPDVSCGTAIDCEV